MDLEATLADVGPGLLRYCTGTSGNSATGEELAQEAMTALVSEWRRHGPPRSPHAFVYVVARRMIRRWRWRRRLLVPLETLVNGHRPDPDPETAAAHRIELRHALAAIRRLPDRERQAMLLAISGDFDVTTAAGVLGISRSAFKMRVHRARRKLASHLESNDAKRPTDERCRA